MLPIIFYLFSVSIDYAYVVYVYPVFGYSGMALDVISVDKILIKYAVFLFVSLSFMLFKKDDKNFLFFISVLIVLPIGTIYSFGGGADNFFYFSILFYFLISCTVYSKLVLIKKIPYMERIDLIALFFLVTFLVYFLTVKLYPVLSLFDFNVNSVALRRELFLVYYNKLDAYMIIWLFSAIVPIALWRSLIRHNNVATMSLLLISLLSFPLTYRKEFILITLFVVLSYYVLKSSRTNYLFFIAVVIAGLVVGFGDQLFIRYFVNRQFISIGVNQYMYYDFISDDSYVLFSNSFLSVFLDYPYHDSLPKIIGALRYNSEFENRSNAGAIGAAYMQGGLAVIVLYAIVIGVIYNQYKLFDRVAGYRSINLFSIFFVYKLSNNDLITTILTGGVLMYFIIIVIGYKRSFRGLHERGFSYYVNTSKF